MKFLTFLVLLVVSCSSYASMRASTLLEVLDGADSVFYGEVISGRIKVETSEFQGNTLEDQYGTYEVKVIGHIAGHEYSGIVTVKAEFSAIMIGGLSYKYPAPGLRYIFILRKNGDSIEFSPYHLPEVELQLVSGGQHAFVENVNFTYESDDWKLKKDVLSSKWLDNEINPKIDNMVGYDLKSYAKYIASHFGKKLVEQ